jgi:hypothetical protein
MYSDPPSSWISRDARFETVMPSTFTAVVQAAERNDMAGIYGTGTTPENTRTGFTSRTSFAVATA